MDNLEIYSRVCEVPSNAQKEIKAGRIKGFTDINPMWRIKKLTEVFGACGVGWYTDDVKHWLEDGADGTKTAHVTLNLYVKENDEWSKPIFGIGGASYISNEKSGFNEKSRAYTSDECFKMAYTDALSVACKALGFGANVYWSAGRSKYNSQNTPLSPADEKQDASRNAKNTAAKGIVSALAKARGKSDDEILDALMRQISKPEGTTIESLEYDDLMDAIKILNDWRLKVDGIKKS